MVRQRLLIGMWWILATTCLGSPIERFSKTVTELQKVAVGMSERGSVYPWHTKTMGAVAGYGSSVEFNNYDSQQSSLQLIFPLATGSMYHLGFERVFVTSTAASDQLAHTPYRQSGRPDRWVLSHKYSMALFEGIGGHLIDYLDTMQFVLFASARWRLNWYQQMFGSSQLIRSMLAPRLEGDELVRVQEDAPAGMLVDERKWDLLASLDLVVFTHRGLMAIGSFAWGQPLGKMENGISDFWEAQLGVGFLL